jgi:hypothetical protein
MLVVLAFLHHRGWSTEPMRLADGREFRVLNFDRNVSYMVDAKGRWSADRYFWVRYYAHSSDRERMRDEARSIAPALFPVADSLGFQALKVEPARPLLLEVFPVEVWSVSVRFVRGPSGAWTEVKP